MADTQEEPGRRAPRLRKEMAPERVAFIEENTELTTPPLVPEIKLHLATEIVPIWQLSEEELAQRGLPPPFWAFAWAGGQALARYVLDHPDTVSGKRVLDFGSGSGLVAIAAAKAGGAPIAASEIDLHATTAIKMNAWANEVWVMPVLKDLIGEPLTRFDTILAADICYEQPLADRITDWLAGLAVSGTTVLVGDPGRTYLPKEMLEELASYDVQTTRELEDREIRHTSVWRFSP